MVEEAIRIKWRWSCSLLESASEWPDMIFHRTTGWRHARRDRSGPWTTQNQSADQVTNVSVSLLNLWTFLKTIWSPGVKVSSFGPKINVRLSATAYWELGAAVQAETPGQTRDLGLPRGLLPVGRAGNTSPREASRRHPKQVPAHLGRLLSMWRSRGSTPVSGTIHYIFQMSSYCQCFAASLSASDWTFHIFCRISSFS